MRHCFFSNLTAGVESNEGDVLVPCSLASIATRKICQTMRRIFVEVLLLCHLPPHSLRISSPTSSALSNNMCLRGNARSRALGCNVLLVLRL
eukprot:g6173.t1